MKKSIPFLSFFFFLFFICCQPPKKSTVIAIVDVRLIDGNGGEPVENAIVLIENGYILSTGKSNEVNVPKNANIIKAYGKTMIPGLINSHAHVGYRDEVNASHYSTEQIQNQLELYARFGVTTVVSLGEDREQAVAYQAVNDTVEAVGRARLYIAGNIITGDSIEHVKAMVDENAKNKTDFIKIRVDNNRGRSKSMPPEIYKAIINQSHKYNLMVAAHMYDLQIAKDLLDSGADFLAHSVRDQEVDEELIDKLKTKRVCYCPTLTRDLSTFAYGETPDFFFRPFLFRKCKYFRSCYAERFYPTNWDKKW